MKWTDWRREFAKDFSQRVTCDIFQALIVADGYKDEWAKDVSPFNAARDEAHKWDDPTIHYQILV